MSDNIKGNNVKNPDVSGSSENFEEVKVKPSRYLIYFSENKIIIINNTIKEKFLQINRENNYTRIFDIKELNKKYTVKKTMKFFAVFGRVDILGIPFLGLISKAKLVANFSGKKIYKILSIKFLTINKNHYKSKSHEKCCEHLEKLKKYIKVGFYFSYNYNLHKEFSVEEFQKKEDIKFEINSFVWNYKSLQALAPKLNIFEFFTPIIQGYVGYIKKEELNFLLISRRSFLMGGTRYNSRGIDINGHVGNFVESEQIIINKNDIFSFIQVRGSLPFYWDQIGVKAKIKIHQTIDINKEQFLKHIMYLQKKMGYKNIVIFNLLGLNRGDENILTKYLLDLLQKSKDEVNNIYYYHVDFHALTKETDFSSINDYITKSYKPDKISYNHYNLDTSTNTYNKLKSQKGLIRTNCMDCLDRTNVVQTKYSYLILDLILTDINSSINKSKIVEPLVFVEKSNTHFISDFRRIWADNGDNISTIYAGTGATTSSVTRKGEKSGLRSVFDHGLKSISRFYLNNFDDGFKQEVIDCILNTKNSSIRHSELNLNFYKKEKFSFGIVSIISKKRNGHVEFNQKFIKELFDSLKYLNFVFFVSYLSKKKKIKIIDKDNKKHNFDSFLDLFKSFSFHNFKICSDLNLKGFEVILFGKSKDISNFGFYKDEKAKLSNFSQSLGVKTSYVINDHSVELFGLKMGKKSMEKKFDQLIEKYIDKNYDIVLIIINGDESIFFDSIGKNYTLLFDNIVNFKNNKDNTNQVHFFCSNKMIEKKIEPLYRQVKIDMEGFSPEVTLNAHSFVFKGFNN